MCDWGITDFMHVSYMIHWALVEFLFLQFTPIPLVYLQIEKNDKTPLFNVHRVKCEQFRNLIEHHNFPRLKLIEIVILWVYYTIPFGFSLFRLFLVITFQLFKLTLWLRITDEGSVPEMRIWSMSLILSDLKMVYTS